MWLDRFSGQSTPAGSPPPQNRSYSLAPRRPSHLVPGAGPRPGFSPRTSSLNVAKLNSSTTSLNSPRLPNGSGLKQQVIPPNDSPDPLKVLEEIVGKPLSEESHEVANDDVGDKPSELLQDVDFDGLGLHDFLHGDTSGLIDQGDSIAQTAEECEYVCSHGAVRVLVLNV